MKMEKMMRIVWCCMLLFTYFRLPAHAETINYPSENNAGHIPVYALLKDDDAKLPPGITHPYFYSPHEIVGKFLAAVKRGELTILHQIQDESMLTPLRVEYIYEIRSGISSRKLYSELVHPIDIPDQDCCRIHGVSAILDADGHIISTELHLWAKH